jgi:hypothetical protein
MRSAHTALGKRCDHGEGVTTDLISGSTRLAFREYFVGTTLSIIDDAFRAAWLSCDINYDPPIGGQRRTLVEQYYHSLDFTKWDDVRKLAMVYEQVLDDLEVRTEGGDDNAKRQFRQATTLYTARQV